jgi:hypothetical protein
MKFIYQLSGHGWASGYIEVKEGKKVNFICSYTSYGISELLERLYQLVADVPVSEINPNPMFWDEEPNGTLWTLKKVGDSELLLHIEYEQEYPEKREALLKEKVDLLEFAKVVTTQAEILLKKHGIIGYFETWGSEFPLSYYLRLKSFIEKMK